MDGIYTANPNYAFGYTREDREWVKIDISDTIDVLNSTYLLYEIGITDMYNNPYTFASNTHTRELSENYLTIQEYLNTLAGKVIENLTNGFPTLEFNKAFYESLYLNLKIETHLAPRGTHYTQEFLLDDANDVVLVMPDSELDRYGNRILYTVNGLFVRSVADVSGIRLLGAGDIIKRSNKKTIGCIDLNSIGNVKTYDFNDDNIIKVSSDDKYYNTLLVKSPTNLFNKSVALVICGIMYWIESENIYSNDSFKVSLANFNILRQTLRTRDSYDWSKIGYEKINDSVTVESVLDSETLHNLILHESCFLVVVDNPYLEFSLNSVSGESIAGTFFWRNAEMDKPLGILRDNYGRVIDYWPVFEKGTWILYTSYRDNPNYLYDTGPWQEQTLVNDTLDKWKPYDKNNLELITLQARKI